MFKVASREMDVATEKEESGLMDFSTVVEMLEMGCCFLNVKPPTRPHFPYLIAFLYFALKIRNTDNLCCTMAACLVKD